MSNSQTLTRQQIMERMEGKQEDIARDWHICPEAYAGCPNAKEGERFYSRCAGCYVDCPTFKLPDRTQ